MKRILLHFRDLLFALVILVGLSGVSVSAVELMYRRPGCSWCLQWDREIGGVYARTAVGRQLPLHRVDLDGARPKLVLKSPVNYTPTLVLVENGRETGRIEGYASQDFFWGSLERLAEQAGAPATDDRSIKTIM
jgi:thioredoxin-related protein